MVSWWEKDSCPKEEPLCSHPSSQPCMMSAIPHAMGEAKSIFSLRLLHQCPAPNDANSALLGMMFLQCCTPNTCCCQCMVKLFLPSSALLRFEQFHVPSRKQHRKATRSISHRPWLENPDTNGTRKTNREGNEQIIPIIGLKNASKKNDIQ